MPPSSCTPTSNETRVRVEGLSKTSATAAPSSARDASRSAFSSSARSTSRKLVGRKLLACQEVTCQCVSSAGTSTTGAISRPAEALFTRRSRLLGITERDETHVQVNRPLLDEFASMIAGLRWDVALLQEAPPRWFRALGGAARASGVRVLTSRNCVPPLQRAGRELEPRPDRLERGRLEPAARPRARSDRGAPEADAHVRPERRRMQWTRVAAGERRDGVRGEPARVGRPAREGAAGAAGGGRSGGRVVGRRPARVRRRH